MRQIIRAAFESTDDYVEGFQRAVQAIIKETGMSGVDARWLVMRLQGDGYECHLRNIGQCAEYGFTRDFSL